MENEEILETPQTEEEQPLPEPVEEEPQAEETPAPEVEEAPLPEASGEPEAEPEAEPEPEGEPEGEPEPEMEEEASSPLVDALALVLNASEEELAALPEESRKAYEDWVAARINADTVNRLEWVKKAVFALRDSLIKTQEETDEFRILAKNTLQKNVQLLEDQVKFNQYNKILKELATIYSTYCFMLNDTEMDPKLYSNIEGIFEELQVLLEDYGVEKVTAKEGDDFDPLTSKISKRIPTDNPELDKKVAAYKAPGFKKGKVILSYLKADMYVYQEPSAQQ